MKGVSSIITAAFLIAISVSVVGIYSEWAPDFARNITAESSEQSNRNLRCSNAALAISDPVYDRSGDQVDFELENSGTIRFTQQITVTAFNNSLPVNNTTFNGLEVGESESSNIRTGKIPENLLAVSSECPDVEDLENKIQVKD